jgi:hypothetical protein
MVSQSDLLPMMTATKGCIYRPCTKAPGTAVMGVLADMLRTLTISGRLALWDGFWLETEFFGCLQVIDSIQKSRYLGSFGNFWFLFFSPARRPEWADYGPS